MVLFKKAAIAALILMVNQQVYSQGRFKLGIGGNYVSNTYPQADLNDYLAPSVNLSYTFLRASRFFVAIENATSLRHSGDDEYEHKSGFTSSLPVLAGMQWDKIGLYAGTGPAYVKQVSRSGLFNERASGYFLNNLVGVNFRGRSIIDKVLYPEYNIRISYLKSLSQPAYDGGMISLIMFMRS